MKPEQSAKCSSSVLPHTVLDRSSALRARAHALGLSCAEEAFLGWHIEHRFTCIQNHLFTATPRAVLRTLSGCPVCIGLEQLIDVKVCAAALGIECLEQTWLGAGEMFRFRCDVGHEWQQRPQLLVCPDCQATDRPRRNAHVLRRLQETAERRDGRCLSEAYLGSAMKHRFSCAMGHEWEAAAGHVLRGAWCLRCAHEQRRKQDRLRDGLKRLHEAAEAKRGICLSNAYFGADARYTFRCHKGHVWELVGRQVLAGRWCRICAIDSRRLGIDVAKQEASKRGGQCLSTKYRNNEGLLFWACERLHVWRASLKDVRRGQWCKECRRSCSPRDRTQAEPEVPRYVFYANT